MYVVFLSHAAEDARIAAEVEAALERIPGVSVFRASHPGAIPYGDSWSPEIKFNLVEANAFVLLFTQNSIGRYWVGLESGFALARFTCAGAPARVFPLTAEGLPKEEVPPPFRELQIATWDDPGERDAFCRRLRERSAREDSWKGLGIENKYYAWDGPDLDGFQVRTPPVLVLPVLERALREWARKTGVEFEWLDRYNENKDWVFPAGTHLIFETDRRKWKKRLSSGTPWKFAGVRVHAPA